ncbi:MAG TPA: quinate 5-dehydrogenase [Firmicutes bacterium]|nr:quinate 5-dehydrogenase [Bacillota bacterium]
MKRIVSVSIGSSKRDHAVETEILGEQVRIERIGTDGSMEKAIALIRELDGKVDAFGMGGIDLYLAAGRRRYVIRDAKRLAAAAKVTPIVDGSGLKNTLERRTVQELLAGGYPLAGKKVFVVCALDRFGLAESLVDAGAEVVMGDFMFALGLPIPIRKLETLHLAASIIAPIAVQLPFQWLYPTGSAQESENPKWAKWYHWADIVAGDFLFIKKSLPKELPGKVILTNTTTSEDVADLRRRGVATLITTTPELNGRSFGTNVMEALLVAFSGKPQAEITPEDYHVLLDRLGFKPRITELSQTAPAA